MLCNPENGLFNDRRIHQLGFAPPGLVRTAIHVTVVTVQVATTRDLQKEGGNRFACPCRLRRLQPPRRLRECLPGSVRSRLWRRDTDNKVDQVHEADSMKFPRRGASAPSD